MKVSSESVSEMLVRFMAHVKKTDYCWEWTAAKNGENGYGVFSIKNRLVFAHRFSYKTFNGDIPKGLYVCHSCDNKVCINPGHLWLGTAKENIRDCIKKRRWYCGKLKKNNIDFIKEKYKNRELTQKALARMFSVDQRVISRVVRGESYLFFKGD